MALYQEPFLHTYKTTIKDIIKREKLTFVSLEDTIFYPGGGGQPCDTGMITGTNFEARVTKVHRRAGEILHQIELLKGKPVKNAEVTLQHDIERRVRLVKMHTAEHILFKSIENVLREQNRDVKLVKIDLGTDESSIFVDTLDLNWDILFKAEEMANRIVREDREIILHQLNKEEVSKIEDLRIKIGKIKEPNVRVVEIKDFDHSACTGVHAKTTSFVGDILITHFHIVKGIYEIRFAADAYRKLLELSRAARITAHRINKPVKELYDSVKKLKDENENLKRLYRELSAKSASEAEEKRIGNIRLVHNVVENAEKKQVIEQANRMLSEKTVVFIANNTNGISNIILISSPDLKIDIPALLLEIITPLDGKGGGRGNFANGSIKKEHLAEFTRVLTEKLKVLSENVKKTH